MRRSAVCLLLTSYATGCHRPPDEDRDGSPTGVDCDDGDADRAVGLEETVGDGVDQDCDGSDRPTLDLRQEAAGRYASDLPGAQLGFTVACGPDRGGDGVGDLAATASEFGMNRILHTFAAALPGPVSGEHSVEDVLDLRVEPTRWNTFTETLGLVDQARGGGLFVDVFATQLNAPLDTLVGFATESGPMGDVSGDGIDDLVIANMWYSAERGAVFVWFGPLEAGTYTTDSADVRFVGEVDGSWTGRGLALGDFDGDGVQSLVVGASALFLQVPGLVYVFDEPLEAGELTVDDTVAIYRGEEPAASTGRSIVACDTDRDGRDELVVGAHLVDWSPDVQDAGVFYWIDEVP